MNSSSKWNEAYLQTLLQEQVEESLHLDYKACDALIGKADRQKKELSKDVSAFANSDGGVIIYGILEGTDERKHLPEKLDSGFDPNDVSKEWLESVINSRIQRRISGIRIHPIELTTTNPGKFAYVVEIPQSHLAPHQASDKRYYKRFNFESVPMEDYEVRDISNRQTGPDLKVIFELSKADEFPTLGRFWIKMLVRNYSSVPAHHVMLSVWIDQKLTTQQYLSYQGKEFTPIYINEELSVNSNRFNIPSSHHMPIFGNYNFKIFPDNADNWEFTIYHPNLLNQLESDYYIQWCISSPNMISRYGIEKLHWSLAQGRLFHQQVKTDLLTDE